MRAALTALLIGVLFALAPSASAEVSGSFFPEMPGMKMAEKAASGRTPTASRSESSNATVKDDRVPAPTSDQVSAASAGLPDGSALATLPGGRFMGKMGKMTAAPASTRDASDGAMALLTILVVVLFTRFLFRLNDVR